MQTAENYFLVLSFLYMGTELKEKLLNKKFIRPNICFQ